MTNKGILGKVSLYNDTCIMIASKRELDIYDGCLAYLYDDLTSEIPPGKAWIDQRGIKVLVKTSESVNQHYDIWQTPPSYFKIFFGDKYIFPYAYSLMGRRSEANKNHYLRGWDLLGRNAKGKWKKLSSYHDNQFAFGENKTFFISSRESYNGFMLNMTQEDSAGYWALCIGQIDIFGDIYSKPFNVQMCKTCKAKRGVSAPLLLFVDVAVS